MLTPTKHIIHVHLSQLDSKNQLMLLKLNKGKERKLGPNELEKYLNTFTLNHISKEHPLDLTVTVVEEYVRSGDDIYLRGYLEKKENQLILSWKKGSKMVVSVQSIEEKKVRSMVTLRCRKLILETDYFLWLSASCFLLVESIDLSTKSVC